MSGHRYFPADCDATDHETGDRHRNPHGLDDELTAAGTWAPVCPTCDIAMIDRDDEGWLRCGQCFITAVDAGRLA